MTLMIFQEKIQKLHIDNSPPFKKETSVNNLLKNLKPKNPTLSKADLRRQLLLALDSEDEEEADVEESRQPYPFLD